MNKYLALLILTFFMAGCSPPSCDDSKPTSQWHLCSGTEVRKGVKTYTGE